MPDDVRVEVDAEGRLVIPEAMRGPPGVAGGGRVRLSLEDGTLRAVGVAEAIRAVQRLISEKYPRPPGGLSWSEELIAERRAEAEREETGCEAHAAARRRCAVGEPRDLNAGGGV